MNWDCGFVNAIAAKHLVGGTGLKIIELLTRPGFKVASIMCY